MNRKQNIESERITVKNLPETERPYEKCIKYGAGVLSDAELLAVIIRTGNRKEMSVDLAYRILSLGHEKGINSLFHADINQLMKLEGIGKAKACQILCVAELSKRMARSEAENNVNFRVPSLVAAYYREDLRHLKYEQTIAVFLDVRMNLICDRVMFKGSGTASLFEPRDILSEALKAGAVNLILLHNHPSGDATPSTQDLSSTGRMREACNLVGIKLVDHIVIGGMNYTSMSENGII